MQIGKKVWVGCFARFPKARATGLFGYREGSFPPGLLFVIQPLVKVIVFSLPPLPHLMRVVQP